MRSRCGIAGLLITVGTCLILVGPGVDPWILVLAGEGDVPLPSAAWPAGPLDLTVAFGRPVDANRARNLVGQTIPYFEPARSGDKFPAVPLPLGKLRIAGVSQSDNGRTLLLATDPHPRGARYELILGPGSGPGSRFSYDLSGVEAAWSEGNGQPGTEPAWKGWWPELELDSVRKLAHDSAPHQRFLELIRKPGRLILSTQLLLPPGEFTVRIESTGAASDAALGDEQPAATEGPAPDGPRRTDFHVQGRGEPLFLSFTVETGPTAQPLLIRGSLANGRKEPRLFKPIVRDQLLLPWAPAAVGRSAEVPAGVPELAGGDPGRGEVLFLGEKARCSQCHSFRGRGGTIGPELTGIGRKGLTNLYRSIAAPSEEIAPDYVPYTVAVRDGRVFAGVVRAEGPSAIRVTDTNARVTTLNRNEIDQIRPSSTSIMPVGLVGGLGEANLRDLIAYLTQEPPAQTPAR